MESSELKWNTLDGNLNPYKNIKDTIKGNMQAL